MKLDALNRFCASLPAASHVVQWGGADVWKVGAGDGRTGKVFAVARMSEGEGLTVSFKVSDIGWEALRDAPFCRPAPYLASRGLKWIQAYGAPGLPHRELKDLLRASHAMALGALPARVRAGIAGA
jgi:predicted DNA-binding protein (MmcQ/YjbR family)